MATYTDIIITVTKGKIIKDTPINERGYGKVPAKEKARPRRINSTLLSAEEDVPTDKGVSTDDRVKEVVRQNNRIIAGADYLLNELESRLDGRDVPVNPDDNPEIIQSLEALFGSNHGNKITFKMYRSLLEFFYEYGEVKVTEA